MSEPFTPMEILDEMIKAGWGETPQFKSIKKNGEEFLTRIIPVNWRDIPGPDPWPSPYIEAVRLKREQTIAKRMKERLARRSGALRGWANFRRRSSRRLLLSEGNPSDFASV